MSATVRAELSEKLSRILKEGTLIKSSHLLRAYATFATLGALSDGELIKAYSELVTSGAYPKGAVLYISQRAKIEDVEDTASAFRYYSVEAFLRFIVPELAANVSELVALCQSELHSDILLLAHVIIRLRKLLYSNGEKVEEADKPISRAGAALPNNPTLVRLYQRYCKQEDSTTFLLTQKQFDNFYRCINLYPISSEELFIKPIGYKKEELEQLVEILKNQLELSEEQQVELCYRFFVENKQAKYFAGQERLYRFFKIKDGTERKKLFQKTLLLMAKIPPLDMLAALSVRRRAPRRAGKENTDLVFKPNDVPLENALIFPLFASAVGFEETAESGVTILLPSVFFVRKWLRDPMLRQRRVCFVFENRFLCETLAFHFHDPTYGRPVGETTRFLTLSDWCDQIQQGTFPAAESKILAFFCGVSAELQDSVYRLLYRQEKHMELFLVLGSHEFEQARSPFSEALDNPRFRFRTIELFPQGINNSAFPRRKMLVHAEIQAQPTAEKEKILLSADVLNTDLKIQAVVRDIARPVELVPEDLKSLYASVRQLYEQEILSRDSSGKKRSPAFSFPFTPDITIWCSKTYPKHNHGRPRLEAYFCEVAPEGKAERGYADRGGVLLQTKKRIVKLSDSEIEAWLNMIYPFSFVRERRSEKKRELTEYSYSIRENAIEYYTKTLAGENLAIKTFWYLYPNLEDLFSERDYKLLNTMVMQTEIGWLRLQDVQAEEVEEILENSFPNDSEAQLYQRFLIVSKVIDRALELEYCDTNPLAQVIQNVKQRDKLFAQVRKALTKKHFTQREWQEAYRIAASRLGEGKLLYIGVLLRLMTGLSANVICGLKWKDLLYIEDYGIKKLVVTRQALNDGSATKGFESLEDYLCFPCSDVLTGHLEEALRLTEKLYPAFSSFDEWPIVRQAEAVNRRGGGKAMYAPRELESLCRQLIRELQLPDWIVTIPDQGEGTKETNLNSYGGDFLRENFRFWTLSYAGMTNDETAYLIGNTPETTFGRYYCDYLNDASQYLLHVKLRRLDTILTQREEPGAVREYTAAGNLQGSVSTGPQPASFLLRVSLPPEAAALDVDIACSHAVSAFAASMIEEGFAV